MPIEVNAIEDVSIDTWRKRNCLAIMADNHIGIPKAFNTTGHRTEMLYRATLNVADAMRQYADILVIAGDLLDKRRFIETPLIERTQSMMRTICGMYKRVFLLVGNHEYTGAKQTVFDIFRHLGLGERLTIVTKPRRLGKHVLLFPFIGDDYAEIVEQYSTVVSKFAYLIGHYPVVGADLGSGNMLRGLPFEFFSGRISVLGDIHKAQIMTSDRYARKLIYVGSPIQHNFGEEGNFTGGLILNVNPRVNKAVRVEVKPDFSFQTIELDKLSEVESIVGNLNTSTAYRLICGTPEIRREVEQIVADGIACTVLNKQVIKSQVRLTTVSARKNLDSICSEYLRTIREDLTPQAKRRILKAFSALLQSSNPTEVK